jgi:TRAP-type C4-dicarboxylate transport system permease small subunit
MSKPFFFSAAELWLGVEVLILVVLFAFWDVMMVQIFDVDPATRSTMGNVLLAVGVVFGRRIIALKEKVEALEKRVANPSPTKEKK